MDLLVRNGEVYDPQAKGKNDIVVVDESIYRIEQELSTDSFFGNDLRIVDAANCLVIPGFVDPHVHFNGAGGEGGPRFRTPPLQLSQFINAGITTAVGLLGTDGVTRSLRGLLQKARALEKEGITTRLFTGSYQVPSPTITGEIRNDIVLIKKVIGVKIALSDHRSSHPSLNELKRIASEARVAGMLAGQGGIIHTHMGDEANGLSPILKVVEATDIPIEQFAPTHLTRSDELFQQAIDYGKKGGYVDLTAGDSTSQAVATLLKNNVSIDKITISTDGGGSMPRFNEHGELEDITVAPLSSLLHVFKSMVTEADVPLEHAVKMTSTNTTHQLKLSQKGHIKEGYDADLLVLDKETFELKDVIAKGTLLMHDGKILEYGTYE